MLYWKIIVSGSWTENLKMKNHPPVIYSTAVPWKIPGNFTVQKSYLSIMRGGGYNERRIVWMWSHYCSHSTQRAPVAFYKTYWKTTQVNWWGECTSSQVISYTKEAYISDHEEHSIYERQNLFLLQTCIPGTWVIYTFCALLYTDLYGKRYM
jgi:hypothetical protein